MRSRNIGFIVLVCTFGFGSLPAHANSGASGDVAINVIDKGDRVTIQVTGVNADSESINGRSDRVEVPLSQRVANLSMYVRNDRTVKRVEIMGRRHGSVLSVQLRHGRRTTDRISRSGTLSLSPNSFSLTLVFS